MNLSQKNRIVNLLIGMIVVVLVCEYLSTIEPVMNFLNNIVSKLGQSGFLVIGILQFLQVIFIPIPAYFITLTSMKLFPNDLITLFIVTLTAVMLAVLVAYIIGFRWGKKAVIWAAGDEESYDKWVGIFQTKRANLIYLGTILLPIFPDDILAILAGSMKMNFAWYFISNLIGRAIGLVTFMFVFTVIEDAYITIAVFCILLLLLLIYKIIIKRKLRNESCNNR